MYVDRNVLVDAFVMEAEDIHPGFFDNKRTGEVNLWGAYTSFTIPVLQHADIYYIGYRKEDVVFEEGTNKETRQTAGMRLWRTGNSFKYDIEGAFESGRLQTFNPIYPKGGYFRFDPQVGPVNLVDVHPYATINPSGNFNLAGRSSVHRYIGTAYLVKIIYAINKYLSIDAGVQIFNSGPFIDDIISTPKNAFLSNYRLVFKF